MQSDDEEQGNIALSTCFWKFIKENVGITKVLQTAGGGPHASTLSLKSTSGQYSRRSAFNFDERYAKVSKALQKLDYDNSMLDNADEKLAHW